MRGAEAGNPFSEEEWIDFGKRCIVVRDQLFDAVTQTQTTLGKGHRISSLTRKLEASFEKYRCYLDQWMFRFCQPSINTIGADHIRLAKVFYRSKRLLKEILDNKLPKAKVLHSQTNLLLFELVKEMRDIVFYARTNGLHDYVKHKSCLAWEKTFLERLEEMQEFLE